MFKRKEPVLVEGLDDILSGFSTVRNKLEAFIGRATGKRAENSAKIAELEDSNAALSNEIGRAANARDNIKRILGE
jgi:hypothetical protein